jgi:hypothetical protein
LRWTGPGERNGRRRTISLGKNIGETECHGTALADRHFPSEMGKSMAKTTRRQQEITSRVMHEFKHGELERGHGGGKVKSRKQAIAIALNEAGASNRRTPNQKRKVRAKMPKKKVRGVSGRLEREGRAHIGPSRRKKKIVRKTAKRSAKRV